MEIDFARFVTFCPSGEGSSFIFDQLQSKWGGEEGGIAGKGSPPPGNLQDKL